ncbi:hypothetical protein Gotri_028251 [Gossypium trilobum]|uniref:RNase H type-1 domain-containing protein n=1 Tax=Gossypium trilobum TaxID=34281 RepID=A0A7J9FHS1_9ROSI|nr:hypothetical protein [Gossypium trilobum]
MYFESVAKQFGNFIGTFLDYDEKAMAAGSGVIQNKNVSDAFSAEALSCLQGLSFAKEMGFNFVMVEGDSRSTITKINQEKEDGSRIEAYIKDIKNLTQVFISIKFNYIPRMANNVVHRLAREGLQMNEETYWVEDIHDSVRSVVEEDRRRIKPG